MSQTVSVVAPSTLEAGYQFDATVDGKTVTVTVPEGGVKEGETFQSTYTTADDTAEDGDNAPAGSWKVGLFDTCDLCAGLWWMSLCCSPILMGQVMQRLGLDPIGSKGKPPQESSTCLIITVITLICTFVYFLRLPLVIYILIMGTRYRMYMRKKYNIPTENCGDGVEDCCCVFWCGCCMACQTHRQTHDESQYPYQCCSPTGLDTGAPSVV